MTEHSATDIAWFAGLFEGEGCISIERNGATGLTIGMTDRDIIDRVNALFPCNKIQIVVPKPVRPQYNQPKTRYTWRVRDPRTVQEILLLILPYLGERRTAKAREALEHLRTRPGVGGYHRNKTHCARGHEYSAENTRLHPVYGYRKCRTCELAWQAAYRMKKKAEREGLAAE